MTASTRRTTGLVAVVAAVALVITACSTSSKAGGGSVASTGSQSVVATVPFSQLVEAGTLTLCTDVGTAPDEFLDANGKLVGHDIDEGAAIAARLGLKVRWVDSVFDTIILAANTGKCDAVISGQNITTERAKAIDMIPYFTGGDALIIRKDAAGTIKGSDDLCGKKVATVLGSTEADLVKQWSTDCRKTGKSAISASLVPKQTTGLQQLESGLVSAMVFDSDFSNYFVKQHSNKFAIAGSLIAGKPQGISVPKNKPQLEDAIRKALLSMEKDGSLLKMRAKWGVDKKPIPNINYTPPAS